MVENENGFWTEVAEETFKMLDAGFLKDDAFRTAKQLVAERRGQAPYLTPEQLLLEVEEKLPAVAVKCPACQCELGHKLSMILDARGIVLTCGRCRKPFKIEADPKIIWMMASRNRRG